MENPHQPSLTNVEVKLWARGVGAERPMGTGAQTAIRSPGGK